MGRWFWALGEAVFPLAPHFQGWARHCDHKPGVYSASARYVGPEGEGAPLSVLPLDSKRTHCHLPPRTWWVLGKNSREGAENAQQTLSQLY